MRVALHGPARTRGGGRRQWPYATPCWPRRHGTGPSANSPGSRSPHRTTSHACSALRPASPYTSTTSACGSRALDLLLDTDRGLSTIAHELGFASHSHFTAAFRRMVGVTPTRFRRCATGAHARELRTILIERLLPRR